MLLIERWGFIRDKGEVTFNQSFTLVYSAALEIH